MAPWATRAGQAREARRDDAQAAEAPPLFHLPLPSPSGRSHRTPPPAGASLSSARCGGYFRPNSRARSFCRPVAQLGGLLELEGLGRLAHLLLESLDLALEVVERCGSAPPGLLGHLGDRRRSRARRPRRAARRCSCLMLSGVMPCSAVVLLLARPAAARSRPSRPSSSRYPVGVQDDHALDVARGAAASSGSASRRSAGSPPCRRRGWPPATTSGRSSPSRSRLMPTSTSNSPLRRSRRISHALERLDVGVQVAHAHAEVVVVLGQVLGHALGERRDQHALAPLGAQRGSRPAGRPPGPSPGAPRSPGPSGRWAGSTCSTTTPPAFCSSYGAGRRRDVEHLAEPRLELLEVERPVVERRGQAEAVLDQRRLALAVAVVHAAHLRHRLVATRRPPSARPSAGSRAASAAARPARGRRGGASSSRCRGSGRSRAASRGRTCVRW